MPHGDDAGDLDRLEHAVVVVALDRRQGVDHLLVAGAETDAPAGHVVGLAHRRELDADVLGALGRQEAGGLVAVEERLAVGEVVDDLELEVLGQVHDRLEEARIDRHGGRVVRIVQDQQLGLGVQVLADHRDGVEELLIVAQRDRDDVGAGQGHGVDVDREGRVGDDGRIARAQHRQAQVAEAFLGADGGEDFGVRVELDALFAGVLLGHLAAEVLDPVGGAVAVVARVAGGLAELLDHHLAGRVGGVAHAQVDDVGALLPFGVLQRVDASEQIRRQAADPLCRLDAIWLVVALFHACSL